ncbi:hypothetical protein GCM10007049_39400 [Echinicola pacifica]|uniref:Uncharacterized protein n=2 Tax=Echinicola pacifica TaxID=346377 RepID=A0A918QDB5_9BACT|nr:hypothetical protein GCM10007049_39400 [Echinicola pacifica]
MAWKPLINKVIHSYQSFLYPIHQLLYGWLPWTIPDKLKDYITIGLLVGLAFVRDMDRKTQQNSFYYFFLSPAIFLFFGLLLIWPLILFGKVLSLALPFIVLGFYYLTDKEEYALLRTSTFRMWKEKDYYFWNLLGAILLVLLVLFIINESL